MILNVFLMKFNFQISVAWVYNIYWRNLELNVEIFYVDYKSGSLIKLKLRIKMYNYNCHVNFLTD